MGESLSRAAVLGFSGLSVALSFRAGLFNIGAEGQFMVGMAAGAVAGLKLLPAGAPAALAVPTVLASGALAGAAWSLIAGALRQWRGVSEVIVTLMLNAIGILAVKLLTSYDGLLKNPLEVHQQSGALPPGAQFDGWGGTSFHAGIFLVPPAAAALWLALYRMRAGLSVRATGLNPEAARACGIPVERVRLAVFAVSGALAGLGGAMTTMALGYLPNESPYSDYGYMAIAVALVAGLHPLGVLPAALFFGLLETGAQSMQRFTDVPSEVVYLVEGAVILALLSRGLKLPGTRRAAGAAAAASEAG
ncbi:MAG: ABC transporter permease [Planctomycetota bacterium]|nr:ABC transporter permease [Planctomycetota bacterium]